MVLAKDLVHTCKEYPFSQLTHAALQSSSQFNTEANIRFKCKFTFTISDRVFECYARTDVESRIWV